LAENLDRITVRDLRVPCVIGTTEAERARKQEVVVSFTLWLDLRRAGSSDRLEETVDYGELAGRVAALLEASSFHLLEALAEEVAAVCLRDPRVARVEVEALKPRAVPLASSAGVRILRERKPAPDPRGSSRLA
jgi:dihydroneopterin aldolase/D-erythro-7,8-dihydroneopterin triphosphate epimerase